MHAPYNIEKIKQGNIVEFQLLFENLFPKMMALACRFVDECTAQDLVQETFIIYWEHKHTLIIDHLSSYFYKTIQNKCLNHLKHQSVVKIHAHEIAIAEARIQHLHQNADQNTIYEHLETQDLHHLIITSLNKLPARCRQAFTLHYFNELTYKEIALAMHISHRTVEVHVQKALLFLKEDLKK